MNVPLLLCVIVIVLAVVLDSKFKIPLGIVCMVGAFFIGTTFLDMSASQVVNFFPSNVIMTMVLAITYFSVFTANGTTEILAGRMLNLVNGRMWLFPLVGMVLYFVLNMFLDGIAVRYAVGPILMGMAMSGGSSLAMVLVIMNYAAMMGSTNPWVALDGLTRVGQLSQQGYANSQGMTTAIWLNCVLGYGLVMIIYYFAFKCHKVPRVEATRFEKKELNSEQKKSLTILVCTVLALVIPAVLNVAVPSPFTALLAKILSCQLVFSVGIVVSVALRLSNYRDMIKRNNWNIVLMIVGVTFIIKVADTAGLQSVFVTLAEVLPSWSTAPLMLLIGAVLSFFAATPTLYPLLYPICCSLATSPVQMLTLLSCASIGAGASAISPFSSSGANTIALVPEEHQERMMPVAFKIAIITPCILAVFAAFGVFNIISMLFAGVVS